MSAEPYLEWLAFLRAVRGPWCVVIAQQGRETVAQAELARAGWSTYLPMQTIWAGRGKNTSKGRRRNVPLFSRYLFAYCNVGGVADAQHGVDAIVDVRRSAIEGRSVVRIDLLARLMLVEARGGLDLTREKVRPAKQAWVVGDAVKVRAGVMGGVAALIEKVLSEREVVIRLPAPMLGKDEATVHSADLEAA